MIFDIIIHNGKVCFVEVNQGDAWRAIEQMNDTNVHITCYGGYENCLMFS